MNVMSVSLLRLQDGAIALKKGEIWTSAEEVFYTP